MSSPAPLPPPPGSALPPSPPPRWVVTPAPPRPTARTAAGLLLVGAVLIAIGSFLTWFRIGDFDVSGFTELNGEDRDGPVFLGFAVILGAFGITTSAARRLLAIAILAVVFAAFSLIFGLADYADVTDLEDLGVARAGPGLPVVIVGSLVALAGGIVALATRRR